MNYDSEVDYEQFLFSLGLLSKKRKRSESKNNAWGEHWGREKRSTFFSRNSEGIVLKPRVDKEEGGIVGYQTSPLQYVSSRLKK